MTAEESQNSNSQRGNPAYFTGTVWVDEIIETPPATGVNVYRVAFEPGARTAWHTHPKGQILIIESGLGRIQRLGEPVIPMRPGEAVYIAPDVKHWHGANSDSGMVHMAIQPADAGKHVVWLEHVTDAQYQAL